MGRFTLDTEMGFFTATQNAFVATAREDLGYDVRWRQLLRKCKEKRFLRRRELPAGTR